jgi:hypothetical protein
MHIVFQEVHNMFKSRDRALEPSPVSTDSFGIQMLLTPNKCCYTDTPASQSCRENLFLNAMVCDVTLAFLILLIPVFHDGGHFIDVHMN